MLLLLLILLIGVVFVSIMCNNKSGFASLSPRLNELCRVPCSDRDNNPVACCNCVANYDMSADSYENKFRKCMCDKADYGDFCYRQATNFLISL